MNELLSLFLTFARIGGLTFGGGYAMLPMLQKEVVEAKQWATEEELMDYYAIGQCTPGIIAINTPLSAISRRDSPAHFSLLTAWSLRPGSSL